MKKWFVLFLALFAVISLTAGTMTYSLEKAIESGEAEWYDVIIHMNKQVDIDAFKKEMEAKKAPIGVQHKEFIDRCKALAAEDQKAIVSYLEGEKVKGNVKEIETFWLRNDVHIIAKKEVVEAVTQRSDVYLVEENKIHHLIKPVKIEVVDVTQTKFAEPYWDMKAIHADKLWDAGYTGIFKNDWDADGDGNPDILAGTPVLVGNIDTGVDGQHPALKWKFKYEYYNGAVPMSECWLDEVNNNNTYPYDDVYDSTHGTHTMGSICGRMPDGTMRVGVCPDAIWIACKGLGVSGGSTTDLNNCLQWMADPDGNSSTYDDVPVVSSNSWGGGYSSCDTSSDSYVTALEAAGCAVVFAIGNDGPDPSTADSPGQSNMTDFTTFSVGATDKADTVVDFSSRGPSDCNLGGNTIKPEVCAPGAEIMSTIGSEYMNYNDTGTFESDLRFATMWGTSMATPHVAGAIALLRSIYPDVPIDTIKAALMYTAHDITPDDQAEPSIDYGEDNCAGWGLIQLDAALEWLNNKYQGDGGSKLYVSALNVNDATTGNGNGHINAGEVVDLYFGISELPGTSNDLTGVTATLSTDSPYALILNNTATYGPITHGSVDTVFNATPFTVRFDGYARREGIKFTLAFDNGDTASYLIQVGEWFDRNWGRGDYAHHYTGIAVYQIDGGPDTMFVSTFDDGYIYVWPIDQSAPVRTLDKITSGYIRGMTIHPDDAANGDRLITCDGYYIRIQGRAANLADYTSPQIEGTGTGPDGDPIVTRGVAVISNNDGDATNDTVFVYFQDYTFDTTTYWAYLNSERIPMVDIWSGDTIMYDGAQIDNEHAFPNGRMLCWDGHAFWTNSLVGAQSIGGMYDLRIYRRTRENVGSPYDSILYIMNANNYDTCVYISGTDTFDNFPYDGEFVYDNDPDSIWLYVAEFGQGQIDRYNVSEVVLPKPPVLVPDADVATDTSSATFYWHPVAYDNFVNYYEVYRIVDDGTKATSYLIGTTTDTTYTDTDLANYNTYNVYLTVKAVNDYGTSPYAELAATTNDPTDTLGVLVAVAVNTEVANLRAITTDKGIEINWVFSGSGDKVELARSTSSNGEYTVIKEFAANAGEYSYIDSSVETGNTYYYKVLVDGREYGPVSGIYSGIGANVYALDKAAPSPFEKATVIRYQVPKDSEVSIKVYDITGREIRTLVDGMVKRGVYNITWDGRDNDGNIVPGGIYIYKMVSGDFKAEHRIIKVR